MKPNSHNVDEDIVPCVVDGSYGDHFHVRRTCTISLQSDEMKHQTGGHISLVKVAGTWVQSFLTV